MRPADAYQGVGDSLQADVMRFMAIIAFCLMAILAAQRGPGACAAGHRADAARVGGAA